MENLISKYYSSLGRKEKSEFMKEVCERCDIGYFQFDRRRRHDTWSKLEREAVMALIPSDYAQKM